MALTFLCNTHRDWLYFHSTEGLQFADDAYRKGCLLAEQNKPKEAIPFLGCAFEAIEILLELHGAEKVFLIAQLTAIASRLCDSLQQVSLSQYIEEIVNRSLLWVDSEVSNETLFEPERAFLQRCTESLLAKSSRLGCLPWLALSSNKAMTH